MHDIYYVSKQNMRKTYLANEGEPKKLLKVFYRNSRARPIPFEINMDLVNI